MILTSLQHDSKQFITWFWLVYNMILTSLQHDSDEFTTWFSTVYTCKYVVNWLANRCFWWDMNMTLEKHHCKTSWCWRKCKAMFPFVYVRVCVCIHIILRKASKYEVLPFVHVLHPFESLLHTWDFIWLKQLSI